jgi:hypothetical protein
MNTRLNKNLFEPESIAEIMERIDNLRPDTQRQWGKMDAAQMLAHCYATFEVSTGAKAPKRSFLSYTVGPLVKFIYTNEKPLPKNSPTDANFLMVTPKDFDREKILLKKIILQFHEGGPDKVTKQPHSFFGKLTPAQWARGMYKHLDHHLRQFGV